MRVTTTIKEYIINRVSEVYKPKSAALRADYDTKVRAIEAELGIARKRWEEEARAIVSKHGLSVDTKGRGDEPQELVCVSYRFGNKEWRPISTALNALADEKSSVVQNIIVEMELGGDREKLEAMLVAIGEK